MLKGNRFITFIDTIFIEKYHKWLLFISILFFFFFTTNHQLVYLNMGYDYFLQSISSISFINGYGFSIPVVDPNDISTVSYVPNGLWPIGYSLISVPFLLLTGNDSILTYRILFIISTSLLLLVSYRLFALLRNEIDHRYFFMAILFWAITYFPFKNIGVTDILSIAFFLLGLILLVRTTELYKMNKVHTIHLVVLGIFSFLPAFFRFGYYPICVVIPATMFFLYFKQKTLLKYSIITGFTTAMCIVVQMLFMRLYFAAGNNIGDVIPAKTQMFYFSNLLAYDAIFLNAFIDDSIISRLSPSFSQERQDTIFLCLSGIISMIIIVGLFLLVKKKMKKQFDSLSPLYLILLLGFIASITTVLFLSFISIWYPSFALAGETGIRTWVMFSRYHALPMYFFQFFIFILLFAKQPLTIKYLKPICATLLLFSAMINSYYWLIHEYKFQVYAPIEELADGNNVYSYLKNKNLKNENIVYLTTKRGTENEFVENNFSGFLMLKSINPINYYLLPNGIEETANIKCIIAASPSDTLIIRNIERLSKTKKIDTILYSSFLNKYVLYIDKK